MFMIILLLLFLQTMKIPLDPGPERRALKYLISEVPRWKNENHCFSCHNNGNGARTLYLAQRLGYEIPREALQETSRWLKKPTEWNKDSQNEAIYDKKLARIQFASALLMATQSPGWKESEPLHQVARELAESQNPDGSWSTSSKESIGSPTTLGTPLSTVLVRNLLQKTDTKRYERAIARADRWLRNHPVQSVVDASAILLSLEQPNDSKSLEQRKKSLDLIRSAERKEGGWGPYRNSQAEVFDTALVILALKNQPTIENLEPLIKRGRGYLRGRQLTDGSWPETTRPADSTSYAQRIATTAWALEALLATAPK